MSASELACVDAVAEGSSMSVRGGRIGASEGIWLMLEPFAGGAARGIRYVDVVFDGKLELIVLFLH